jgi:hypothetical protein
VGGEPAIDEACLPSHANFNLTISDVANDSPLRRIRLSSSLLPPDHPTGALIGSILIDDVDLFDLTNIPHPVACPQHRAAGIP